MYCFWVCLNGTRDGLLNGTVEWWTAERNCGVSLWRVLRCHFIKPGNPLPVPHAQCITWRVAPDVVLHCAAARFTCVQRFTWRRRAHPRTYHTVRSPPDVVLPAAVCWERLDICRSATETNIQHHSVSLWYRFGLSFLIEKCWTKLPFCDVGTQTWLFFSERDLMREAFCVTLANLSNEKRRLSSRFRISSCKRKVKYQTPGTNIWMFDHLQSPTGSRQATEPMCITACSGGYAVLSMIHQVLSSLTPLVESQSHTFSQGRKWTWRLARSTPHPIYFWHSVFLHDDNDDDKYMTRFRRTRPNKPGKVDHGARKSAGGLTQSCDLKQVFICHTKAKDHHKNLPRGCASRWYLSLSPSHSFCPMLNEFPDCSNLKQNQSLHCIAADFCFFGSTSVHLSNQLWNQLLKY